MTSKPRGALWATKYLVFQIVKSWDVRICEEKYAVGSGHSSGAKVQKSCSVMTSVYEFQKSSKKVVNGFSMWNFKNVTKKSANSFNITKITKKNILIFQRFLKLLCWMAIVEYEQEILVFVCPSF